MNPNVLNVQMGRIDGLNSQNRGKDLALSWTNVYEEASSSVSELGKRKLFCLQSTYVTIVFVFFFLCIFDRPVTTLI